MKKFKLFTSIFFIANCWMLPISAQQLDPISSGDSSFDELGIPRRLIAIDNVCAWPNLSMLENGTIIATIFNQPSHGHYEGDVECWASEDEGLTWKYRGIPTQHKPHTVRMNHAAGVNDQNGELIVLCGGWDNIRPRRNEKSKPLDMAISISKDEGENWERGGIIPPPVKGLSHHTPFGDIMTGENGDLVVGTYVFDVQPDESKSKMEREGHIYTLRSSDGGKSWDHVTPVVKEIHVEAAMLHMGDGKWLSASRRFGYLDLDIHASEDDGFSWDHVTLLDDIPRVSAAHLLKLSDGRVLLTYGNRNPGNKGIDVRLSNDEGKTWSSPQRIIHLSEEDSGYPAALELSEGRIMVAYYSGGVEHHDRYHMGVVNFLLEELDEKLQE